MYQSIMINLLTLIFMKKKNIWLTPSYLSAAFDRLNDVPFIWRLFYFLVGITVAPVCDFVALCVRLVSTQEE